jgi:hypothetical protein
MKIGQSNVCQRRIGLLSQEHIDHLGCFVVSLEFHQDLS